MVTKIIIQEITTLKTKKTNDKMKYIHILILIILLNHVKTVCDIIPQF